MLKILTLNNNHIANFNPCLLKIMHLEFIYLSHNEITKLPEEDWGENNIKILDLEANSLYDIPNKVLTDSKVYNLNLKDNHITKK